MHTHTHTHELSQQRTQSFKYLQITPQHYSFTLLAKTSGWMSTSLLAIVEQVGAFQCLLAMVDRLATVLALVEVFSPVLICELTFDKECLHDLHDSTLWNSGN